LYAFSLALAAYAIALPWSIFYNLPVSGIGFVREHSPLFAWLSFWGPMLTVIALFLLRVAALARKRKGVLFPFIFPALIVGFGSFLLLTMEIIYIKDILREGVWFRANTVFKLTTQIWLWLGLLAGPIFLWVLFSLPTVWKKIVFAGILLIMLLGQGAYPFKAISQTQFAPGQEYVGLNAGLRWWREQYPHDYEAYLFLREIRNALPREDRLRRVVEGEGESYTISSRFSVFLGWPTIIGWPVHEWTWRGSYEAIDARRKEVSELYTSPDEEEAKKILSKYGIDYIIVGEVERELYKEYLNIEKLRRLGNAVFENEKTIIIEVRPVL
jgi:uncharacterized membrane protein